MMTMTMPTPARSPMLHSPSAPAVPTGDGAACARPATDVTTNRWLGGITPPLRASGFHTTKRIDPVCPTGALT